jgi:PKD repeat protein
VLAALLAGAAGCTGSSTTPPAGGGVNEASAYPIVLLQAFPASGPAPLTVNLDGTGSWATDGSALTYDWDFDGDGTWDKHAGSATEQHAYAQEGQFVAILRVTDSRGFFSVASVQLQVSHGLPPAAEGPVAQLQAFPSSGVAPLTVNLDATGSWSPNAGALAYKFDFEGDGTNDLETSANFATHVYSAAGTFNAKLTVKDAAGFSATSIAHITVTPPQATKPVAVLGAYPASGRAPLTVNLDASGSWSPNAGPLTFKYDFEGDGADDLETSANFTTHVYSAAGTFHAKVTVKDSAGFSATATAQITVTAPPPQDTEPVAALSAYPASGKAPLAVTLDASASWAKDGKPLTYAYDVNGDGAYDVTTSRNMLVNTYTLPGTYTPKLRVTDSQGHSKTVSGPVVSVTL